MLKNKENAKKNKLEWRKYQAAELGIPMKSLRTKDLLPNFEKGDFVLVAIPKTTKDHKLLARWRGPYRIVEAISRWEFNVQHLVTKEITTVHIRRMRYYADMFLFLPPRLLALPLSVYTLARSSFSLSSSLCFCTLLYLPAPLFINTSSPLINASPSLTLLLSPYLK